MKVLLDYEQSTGHVMINGVVIGTWMELKEYVEPEADNIDAMIKLKNSGFTAKEVIEMAKIGVL